jgi:enolase
MSIIKKIKAREILDSRGDPTVETKVLLGDGKQVVASVPSGESKGRYEALELRDEDAKRFDGMGVLKAVVNINQVISSQIVGKDPCQQKQIDDLLNSLDGTENKSKLGANAILSVSIAVCKAGALVKGLSTFGYIKQLFFEKMPPGQLIMPVPVLNLINGGKHGAGNLEFQEFHIIPASGKEYHQSLQMAEEIYHAVEKVLIRHGAIHSVGDEGGFAPNLFTNMDALEVIVQAIKDAGYEFEKDVSLGLDVAASHFYKDGKYSIRDRSQPSDAREMTEFYRELLKTYPLHILEDPLQEDDWDGWVKLNAQLEDTITVGDDLLCTNPKRVERAINEKACRAILVKPNQIGTISETFEVIKMARGANWKVIVSHRSGETNDDFIADFAVGVQADFTKFGAPARGERVAKYNRLLEIETKLAV